MWGKDIFLRGYRCRIGDGNSVKVLEDPWILRPPSFKFFDEPHLPDNLYVVDLKLANGQWDEEFIRYNFNENGASLILHLLCGDSEISYKVLWHYSNNGECNVKSGYKVAMSLKDKAESSNMRNSESGCLLFGT